MTYKINQAIEILSQTPYAIEALLKGLSEEWIGANEGPETWSPYDVVGHLIHGEEDDWIPRLKIILDTGTDHRFRPFNRTAMFEKSKGKPLRQLLEEFKKRRAESLLELKAAGLSEEDLMRTGIHPEFGEVTLRQHLACWVAHDLSHIAQIARVMAKQYKDEVGPWKKYLPVLSQ
jgi:hypothetical protein